MNNLIQPSTSINHDGFSQNQLVRWMHVHGNETNHWCNCMFWLCCEHYLLLSESLASDWLAHRTGRRSYGDHGLIWIACVTNHFLFTMFWSHSLFMRADLPCSEMRQENASGRHIWFLFKCTSLWFNACTRFPHACCGVCMQ